ncbi:hypothetical protein BCV69DRAFT_284502 [Microstroma glucosiphilum]|uniref:Uncharacterized protein n=1 Tax=Pseudomicrostroma glucosiphilum TaxID=1684307 RepID=A0A316U0F0_9BASI|nr:hypothetical protein BCV69DRAFT_284502 [Pseudomicrostroma glucosiphilum]PWN18882.1 hypothetical protein BCV69DRAFT_284502 [Pseudomicrostroma glucosiphilum]
MDTSWTKGGQQSTFDPQLCYLGFLEQEYDFMLPASGCSPSGASNQTCTWDVTTVNTLWHWKTDDFPPHNPGSYQCDNVRHALAPDLNDPSMGSYVCGCGEKPGVVTEDNRARFTVPWKASFGKQCNLARLIEFKGNSSGSMVTGSCLTVAGSHGNTGEVWADQPATQLPPSPTAFSVVDGMGIAFPCDNKPHESSPTTMVCNCEGSLPEAPFGTPLENRNACGLAEEKKDVGAIAGGVVGGLLGALLIVLLVAFSVRRHKRLQTHPYAEEDGGAGIELQPVGQGLFLTGSNEGLRNIYEHPPVYPPVDVSPALSERTASTPSTNSVAPSAVSSADSAQTASTEASEVSSLPGGTSEQPSEAAITKAGASSP